MKRCFRKSVLRKLEAVTDRGQKGPRGSHCRGPGRLAREKATPPGASDRTGCPARGSESPQCCEVTNAYGSSGTCWNRGHERNTQHVTCCKPRRRLWAPEGSWEDAPGTDGAGGSPERTRMLRRLERSLLRLKESPQSYVHIKSLKSLNVTFTNRVFADVSKCRILRSSRISRVGPKGTHKCPRKRRAGEGLRRGDSGEGGGRAEGCGPGPRRRAATRSSSLASDTDADGTQRPLPRATKSVSLRK